MHHRSKEQNRQPAPEEDVAVTASSSEVPQPARTPGDEPADAAHAHVQELGTVETVTKALAAMSAFDFSVEIPVPASDEAQLSAQLEQMPDPLEELARAAQVLQHELRATAVSASYLQSVLDSIPNPIALLDLGGHTNGANPPMVRLLVSDDVDDVEHWLRAHRPANAPAIAPIWPAQWKEPLQVACMVDGEERHYLFSVAPLLSHLEETEGYVVVGTDISARIEIERHLQQAKEQAEAAAQARADFLANVSHEVRTPLHGILGSAELLQTRLVTADAEAAGYSRTIQACAKQLLALVNDLLDFTRIDANQLALEERPFDLPALLRDCMDSIDPTRHRPGVSAKLSLTEPLPRYVRGDPVRVRQVLHNLLDNAFKFTHQGLVELRAVCVSRDKTHADIRIEVRDTGIGIPEDQYEAIFAPLTQVDSSKTRAYGGTGLGLALVYRLIQLMHGQIGVDSQVGQGSNFWFGLRLPIMVEEIRPVSDEDDEDEALLKRLSGTRVLLVEDNLISQRIAMLMLQKAGCDVTVASHGAEALDRLAEAQFDVVLMDCQMPVMDGLTATRELRRRERAHRTPIIALTADAFEVHRQRCMEAGMDGYLRKPVRKATLCRVIGEHLTGAPS